MCLVKTHKAAITSARFSARVKRYREESSNRETISRESDLCKAAFIR